MSLHASTMSLRAMPAKSLRRDLGFASTTAAGLPPLHIHSRSATLRMRGVRLISAVAETETEVETGPSTPLNAAFKTVNRAGLDTTEGIFGFKPFGEMWVGRSAMLGFTIGLVEEFITGDGILAQIGLMEDGQADMSLFYTLLGLMGGATLVGLVLTFVEIQSGKMSVSSFQRYASFLGLKTDAAAEALAASSKKEGDFTSPDNYRDIRDAKGSSPADKFLAIDPLSESKNVEGAMKTSGDSMLSKMDIGEIDDAAQELKATGAAATPRLDLDADSIWLPEASSTGRGVMSPSDAGEYAKNIELGNGRWAMVGFASAILIEAATGDGIIPQLFFYLKAIGLLGADSGF